MKEDEAVALKPCPFCKAIVYPFDHSQTAHAIPPTDYYSINHSPDCFLFNDGASEYTRIPDPAAWNLRADAYDPQAAKDTVGASADGQSLADKLAAYTSHVDDCEWWGAIPRTVCDCGLADLLESTANKEPTDAEWEKRASERQCPKCDLNVLTGKCVCKPTKPYKTHLYERLQTLEDCAGYLRAALEEGDDVFNLAVCDVINASRSIASELEKET